MSNTNNNQNGPPSGGPPQALQYIIHATGAVLFACGGFIISMAFTNIDRLENKFDQVPKEYVLKADYRADQARVFVELTKIAAKIDHSMESLEADYNRRMDKLEKILTEQYNKDKK